MKRAFTTSLSILLALLFVVSCRSSGGDLSRAETQRRFGVRMAKMDLWREAMFRFKRATEIEPDNPMAHNNLAVAYEATGNFDGAMKEYREALRLDRSNQYIQKNYSRFVEFTQRSRKREAKPEATPATTTNAGAARATPAAPPPSTPATSTAPPQPSTPPEPATTTAPPPPPPARTQESVQ